MESKRVITIVGEEVEVDYSTRKIHSFCNADRVISWSAERVDDRGFWVEFQEEGVVNDIESKLEVWNNPVRFIYARKMDFNATKNDPDGIVWNTIVEWSRENESLLFDKNGDWKKSVSIDPKTMQIRIRGGKRAGAGRKPSGLPPKKVWSVKVTEEERAKLKELLKEIRGE